MVKITLSFANLFLADKTFFAGINQFISRKTAQINLNFF
jgi:hypothetical protein